MYKFAVKHDRKACSWRQEPRPLSGKCYAPILFLTYLVVRLCFDWIQSFSLKPVLPTKQVSNRFRSSCCALLPENIVRRFQPDQMSMKTTDVTNSVQQFQKSSSKRCFLQMKRDEQKNKSWKKKPRNNSIQNGASHVILKVSSMGDRSPVYR